MLLIGPSIIFSLPSSAIMMVKKHVLIFWEAMYDLVNFSLLGVDTWIQHGVFCLYPDSSPPHCAPISRSLRFKISCGARPPRLRYPRGFVPEADAVADAGHTASASASATINSLHSPTHTHTVSPSRAPKGVRRAGAHCGFAACALLTQLASI